MNKLENKNVTKQATQNKKNKNEKNSKNKFVNLNFNLKYEIIEFLPIKQQLNQTTKLNKRFNFCLNKKQIFSLLKSEGLSIIKNLSFTVKQINIAKECLLSASRESEEKVDQILKFLLLLKHKNSTFLNLTETKYLDCFFLSSFLAENKNMQHLFLFENKLGKKPEDLKFLCLGLLDNCSIKDLYVSQNKIGKHATDLVFVNFLFLLNRNLTIVDFSYNRIGKNNEDVKHLANALKHNKSLKSLNLSANRIGATNKDDFLQLCAALAENDTLESIDLAFNFVENSDENVDAFLLLMRKNTNLKFFSLMKNPIEKHEKFV